MCIRGCIHSKIPSGWVESSWHRIVKHITSQLTSIIFWHHLYNNGVPCFGLVRLVYCVKFCIRTGQGHLPSWSPNILVETLHACEWHKFTLNILSPASSAVVSAWWLVWKEPTNLIQRLLTSESTGLVWNVFRYKLVNRSDWLAVQPPAS